MVCGCHVDSMLIAVLIVQASVLESECNKMSPDMAAIEEYRAKAADYAARAAELDAVTSERDQVC